MSVIDTLSNMRKKYLLIHLLLGLSALGFSQNFQTETEYLDSMIVVEYPALTSKYELLRLDTIHSTEVNYIRFWSDSQIITIAKNEKNEYSGELINLIEKLDLKKGSTIYTIENSKIFIDSIRARNDYLKAINLGLKSLPTESEIDGWKWLAMDGKTFTIETLISDDYKIRTYNSPESVNDTITFKKEILSIVNYFETSYKVEFEHFFNELPKGTYRIRNMLYLK